MSKNTKKEVEQVSENEVMEEVVSAEESVENAETKPAPEKKKLGKWAKIGIGAGIAATMLIVGSLFSKSDKGEEDEIEEGEDSEESEEDSSDDNEE